MGKRISDSVTAKNSEADKIRHRIKDRNFSALTEKENMVIKRVLMSLLTIAIIVVVFAYVLPRFASYSDVFREMGSLSIWQLLILIGVAVLNIASAWTVNQVSLPGMSNRQAAQLTLSQNLISNSLPLGGAWSIGLGYAIIHSYGFGPADYSLMLAVSGIWNNFARFALPVSAVLMLLITGDVTTWMITITVVGVSAMAVSLVVLIVILRSRSLAIRVGDATGRAVSWFLHFFNKEPITTWGEGLARFRDQVISVTKTRWPSLTLWAVMYQLTTFWVFLAALRFSNVPAGGSNGVSWVMAFAVFAFVRIISAIPVTPGAVGIAEASFTSLMVAAGGSEPEVVAGVLLFRMLTWVMPILMGLPVCFTWWLKQRRISKVEAVEGEEPA